MARDHGGETGDRFPPRADRWSNGDLIRLADEIAEAEGPAAPVLRELARRYRVAVDNERKRYLSAAEAFGVVAPIDRKDARR